MFVDKKLCCVCHVYICVYVYLRVCDGSGGEVGEGGQIQVAPCNYKLCSNVVYRH